MGLMIKIKNIINSFRELGVLNGFLYLLARALNRCNRRCNVYKYYLVAQPVFETARLSGRRGKSVIVRLVEPGDATLKQMNRPVKTLEQRFSQGSICLGAFKDSELAGYMWLHFSAYPEDEVRCSFELAPASDTAWDFDIFIAPKHRLGYTFSRLWDEADALLRTRGVCWTMSRISAFNPVSLTSHSRMGLKTIGSAIYVVGFQYQLMFATIPPYLHFSLTPESYPTLRLRAPSHEQHECSHR